MTNTDWLSQAICMYLSNWNACGPCPDVWIDLWITADVMVLIVAFVSIMTYDSALTVVSPSPLAVGDNLVCELLEQFLLFLAYSFSFLSMRE